MREQGARVPVRTAVVAYRTRGCRQPLGVKPRKDKELEAVVGVKLQVDGQIVHLPGAEAVGMESAGPRTSMLVCIISGS